MPAEEASLQVSTPFELSILQGPSCPEGHSVPAGGAQGLVVGPDAMQSFIEVAPRYIVVYPEGQAVHMTDPVSFAYLFIGHSMHMAPLGLNLPAGQNTQLLGSVAVGC